MRSIYVGIDAAISGLYASQSAISVTNHNINNANSEGYSRQVLEQKAMDPIHSYGGTGMIGRGVQITSVSRVRNEYLDLRYREKNSMSGEWDAKQEKLTALEYIFNDNSEVDLNEVTSNVFDAVQELSKNPESEEIKTMVQQAGISFCQYMNSLSNEITDERNQINQEIQTNITQLNTIANQIADLNRQIFVEEIDGKYVANDLRDSRDKLVDELSNIVDVDVNEVTVGIIDGREDKRFQITLDGIFLVNHDRANELETYQLTSASLPPDEQYKAEMCGIRWKESGNEFNVTNGKLRGLIETRDGTGKNGEYKGLPYYTDMLDEFAQRFARAINEGENLSGEKLFKGFSDGVNADGETGLKFFTYSNVSSEELEINGYDEITAATISVSKEIAEDEDKIPTSTSGTAEGNNDILKDILDMRSDNSIFDGGQPEDFIKSLISNLGTDSQMATKFASQEKLVLSQIDNQRMSVSGVSLDEEMINIVKYQQAYKASAKMINIFNELLDIAINGII